MLDPSTPNQTASVITNVLVWIREISVIGVIAGAAWKSRGAWDAAQDFLDDIKTHLAVSKVHMEKMERFAATITDNHLEHIETALNAMANIEPGKNE